MEMYMKENIFMGYKKDTVNLNGMMEEYIKVRLKMENNTVKED